MTSVVMVAIKIWVIQNVDPLNSSFKIKFRIFLEWIEPQCKGPQRYRRIDLDTEDSDAHADGGRRLHGRGEKALQLPRRRLEGILRYFEEVSGGLGRSAVLVEVGLERFRGVG